ncbi:hypothetical protein [Actinomadura pelletieri]|uniref:hypothetical protein n=1 Tax=Actinomadura pelletieri TaxID=111805 RepID=UPI000EAE2D06|nr:hypothetical protein [Actinomadura pelletieri]
MNAPVYAWDRARVAAEVKRRYGALAWYGTYTGRWWAMVDGARLVEADDPRRLVQEIMAARRALSWRPY